MKSKARTALMLGVLVTLVVTTLSPATATTATVMQDSLATNSKELYEEMVALRVDDDKEAWMALVEEGLLDGSIIWIYEGDKVYWEGTEGWLMEMTKFRIPGDRTVYYTATENIDL